MQSMDEIYREYARTVYKYLLSKTCKEDIAEELTQETFYQALRSIERFDGSCKISTWLCAIAKNQYLSYLRKHPVQEDIASVAEAEVLHEADTRTGTQKERTDSPEELYLQMTDRVTWMKLLHDCPEPFREVLYLRIFGNLSFREIGEIMEKSENWARVTFYRGKEKIRKDVSNRENKHSV